MSVSGLGDGLYLHRDGPENGGQVNRFIAVSVALNFALILVPQQMPNRGRIRQIQLELQSAFHPKLIVRDMLDRQMDGVHWLLPKDMSGGFSDPSLPLRGSDAVNVLRNAAKSTLGSSHEIGTSGVPAAWFSVRATQRGVMRLQTHLDRLRTLLTNTRACEDYSIDLRLSERKVSLDLSLRLTAKGAPIAAMNLPAGVHGEPIRPGLLNCSITLISSFVSQPAHPRLHQWFTDRGHDTFREWWTSFASVDVWISEVLRALAWQCDHAWLLGHRPYVDLGPPARGALHRLRNRLRDRADDPSLLSWLRTQLHQLRREIVLGLFVSPPAFCVADLGAILTEVFRLEPPAPAVLVPVAPELLRDELLELSTNCRKYSIGDPRVSLEVDGSRCDVAIVNVKNAECGGTRYGLDLLRRRLQTAGIEVFVEDSEVIFTIRLRLRQHEICKGGGNDEAKH
jgi:hypothetical protein